MNVFHSNEKADVVLNIFFMDGKESNENCSNKIPQLIKDVKFRPFADNIIIRA